MGAASPARPDAPAPTSPLATFFSYASNTSSSSPSASRRAFAIEPSLNGLVPHPAARFSSVPRRQAPSATIATGGRPTIVAELTCAATVVEVKSDGFDMGSALSPTGVQVSSFARSRPPLQGARGPHARMLARATRCHPKGPRAQHWLSDVALGWSLLSQRQTAQLLCYTAKLRGCGRPALLPWGPRCSASRV